MDILQSLIPYIPAIVILSGAIAYGIKRYSDGKLFEIKSRLKVQENKNSEMVIAQTLKDISTIIYIDDNVNDHVLVRRVFKQIGMENKIVFRDSASSGLSYLRDNPETVMFALVDIRMVSNGYRFLEEVKLDDQLKKIPIILLSGVEDVDIEDAFKRGAIGYLEKPLDIFKLLFFLNNQGFSIHIER